MKNYFYPKLFNDVLDVFATLEGYDVNIFPENDTFLYIF